jgi:hypothetical protein
MSDGLYPKKYGAWSGNPEGNKPDYERCCVEVWSKERWSRVYQCHRKRGHGPDGAYCSQHVPEVVEQRKRAASARQDAEWQKRRLEFSGKIFYDALVKIAEGHNDARGLAQETIASFTTGNKTHG